jgi:hypothetical protein
VKTVGEGAVIVFVGCNYTQEPVSNFRAAFDNVEKTRGNVAFVFADTHVTSNSLLGKIQYEIAACDHGLFDITYWNPNVLLEFGIAMGKAKEWAILFNPYADAKTLDKFLGLHSPAQVPLLLQGHELITYASRKELEHNVGVWVDKTSPRLPEIANGDFTKLRLRIKQIVEKEHGISFSNIKNQIRDQEDTKIKIVLDYLLRNQVLRREGAGLGIGYFPFPAPSNRKPRSQPRPDSSLPQ